MVLMPDARGDSSIENQAGLQKYRIGVVPGDLRDQYFSSQAGYLIERYGSSEEALSALNSGEIDLLPVAELSFPYLREYFGYPQDRYRQVFFSSQLNR